jgi:hypothetical protein
MPALGGYNPAGVFGGLRGDKPKIPNAFFTMEAEEIVAMLMSMGYTERNARVDVAKFMKYKERQAGPKQIFSDDEEPKPVPENAPSKTFSQSVNKLKGGQDE